MLKKSSFLGVTALVAAAGCAETNGVNARATGNAAEDVTQATANASAPNPTAAALKSASDASLMTLSGTVAATGPNWFRLNAGGEEVTVEMDDWDWYNEGKALKAGDSVVVTGRVDKGFWEQNKLEASSVYVRNLGVTFFADGADEEEMAGAFIPVDVVTSTAGLVTSLEGQEFTVGAVAGPVRVDAAQVKPKPKVKLGDRVYAWGDIDLDPAEGAELMADGIVVISPANTPKPAPAEPAQNSSS